VYKGTLTMNGCSVTNNTGAYYGGAVDFWGTATLANCIIESNSTYSYGSGGGVYSNGTLTMSGTKIRSNTSGLLGGGVCFVAGTATLASCTVESNCASLSTGEGGGLYNGGATLTLVKCAVKNNSAGKRGGGIGTSGSLSLKNACTITGNTPDKHLRHYGYTSDGTNQIGTSPNKSATAFSGYSGETEPEPARSSATRTWRR
jgi:predicted outer membrane repeat protein